MKSLQILKISAVAVAILGAIFSGWVFAGVQKREQ
jgi:hypothetical protein